MNSQLHASPHGGAFVHNSRSVAPLKGIVKPRPSMAAFIALVGFDFIIIFD
jgi:hypothetical protein